MSFAFAMRVVGVNVIAFVVCLLGLGWRTRPLAFPPAPVALRVCGVWIF